MSSSDSQPPDWREWRRIRALELATSGWKQRDMAFALDASETCVSEWLAAAERGGAEALRSHPRPGPVGKLAPEQLGLLPDLLWHGPEAYGFRSSVCTCERVVGVLYEEFGVSSSKSQASRLLKSVGWTPQVPITRAIQPDEQSIERWRAHSWPALRERARRGGFTLILRMSAASTCCQAC
jgi:transposase